MTKLRIVRVDWIDANGGVLHGWRDIDAVRARQPANAVAFGILLRKDKKAIMILPHVVGPLGDLQGDGEIVIPCDWVTKITTLGYL